MKNTHLVLLLAASLASGALAASAPKLTFTKSFPGSQPAYVSVDVNRDGTLTYSEAVKDDQPLVTRLPDADVTILFDLAQTLSYFKTPLESGLKVANTGQKTFRYTNDAGATSQSVFNYSTIPAAHDLLEHFEQIAATERAYLDLDHTARYDKLGVNESLAQIESLWLRKELVAPKQFVPLLSRIASHEAYMHMARDRAARLKDSFSGVVTADVPTSGGTTSSNDPAHSSASAPNAQ